MKKTPLSTHIAYIAGLALFGGAAIFFAVAWKFRMAPLKTEWGDWATWTGAIGTIAGFGVAIWTLQSADKRHRKAEKDDRIIQARRVGITSIMEVEPAPGSWETHMQAWDDDRADSRLATAEERAHMDAYDGPWVGRVSWTAQNGSPYPLFSPKVTVDASKVSLLPTVTKPVLTSLPALLPGGTATGTFSLDLRSHNSDDMVPDLVELEFTDVWKDRWHSTSSGCEKIEVSANSNPPL